MYSIKKLYETELHSRKAIPWSQFKNVGDKEAIDQLWKWLGVDYGNKPVGRWGPEQDDEEGEPLTGKDLIEKYLMFVARENGAWEAVPLNDVPYWGGSFVWHPKEKSWADAEYMDDDWLDSAMGVKNWRSKKPNYPPGIGGGSGCASCG